MLKCLKAFDVKKSGIFAAGVLFGTAGVKVLASEDAKKFYTGALAIFAIPIFTISLSRRLISAGLPAPSKTMASYWLSRRSNASLTAGMNSIFLR